MEVLGIWYLVAPRNCSAPVIAEKLCRGLGSVENCVDRLEKGIGAPPYESLYGAAVVPGNALIDFMAEHFMEAANSALVRSSIPGYLKIARVLGYYLKRLLEIEGSPLVPPRKEIRRVFGQALKSMDRIHKSANQRG